MTLKYNIYISRLFILPCFVVLSINLSCFSQVETKHSHEEIVSGVPKSDSIWSTINHFTLQEIAISKANQNSNKSELHNFLNNRFPDLDYMFLKFYRNNSETAIIDYKNWLLKEYSKSIVNFTPKNNARIQASTVCDNIDFENGDFSNWEASHATACSSLVKPCNVKNSFAPNNQSKFIAYQHVITDKSMTDLYIPTLPVVYPGKGNYSVRIGNYRDSTQAASLRKTFLVTPNNNVFTYHYAVVLEEPPGDHQDNERPFFRVKLFDQNGNEIKCAEYNVIARSPITNFIYNPVSDPFTEYSNGKLELFYRNWTDVSIPLFKYVGQKITVEFTASDCARKGHFGYAYIDADCGSIIPTQLKTCEDAVDSLETPLGFAKYVWTGPGILGDNTSNKIKINKAGIYKVAVSPVSDLPCPDTLYYTVLEKCKPAPVNITLCETNSGTLKTENVDLNNYIKLVTAYKNPPGKLLNWYSAMPAANNILTNISNITIQNGDSLYATVFISNTREDTVLVKFIVQPAQKVVFPPISPLCENGAPIQLNTTPSGGVYSGNMVSTTGLFTPQKSDTVSVKYVYSTAGGGCKDSLSLDIIILPKPTINAGIDQTICESDTIINLSGLANKQTSVQWSGGNGLFENNLSTITKYHLSKADINTQNIKLIITANATAPCVAVNDTLNIKIINNPTVDAGANQSICKTNGSIVLNGTSANQASTIWSGGLGTFANKNTTSTAYTPTLAEKNGASFKLYLTANALSPCKNITDSVEITLANQPTVNAGIDQTICESDSIIDLSGLANKQKSLLWSGGNGLFENNLSTITKYHLSKADINTQNIKLILTANATAPCVAVNDTLNINIIKNPAVDAGANQSICETNGSIVLNGSSTNQASTIWSGGLGTFANINTTSTAYTPTLAEKNGASFKLYLTANALSPCKNITDSVEITLANQPTVNAGIDQTICESDSIIDLSGLAIKQTSIQWSGGNGLFENNFNAITKYHLSKSDIISQNFKLILTATATAPCITVKDTLNIKIIYNPTVDAGANQSLCETNGSIVLNGSSTNQSTTFWSGGLGSFANDNATSTIYTPALAEKNGTSFKLYLTAFALSPCKNITDSMNVKIVKIPTLDISQNIKICSNQDSIFIIPNSIQSQSFSYKKSAINAQVYVDSVNQTFIYKPSLEERQSGKSSLIVSTVNNQPCPEVSDSINFTFFASPKVSLPPLFKFCSDSIAGINIISELLPVSYLWKPNNETSESILANSPGIYTLIISDTNNCKADAKTLVQEVCPPRLFPPSAFSPDGDNTNDYFVIHGAHIGKYRLLIYNRWGEVIFESLNINNSWNGYYHGELMPIGVYPWTLIYEGDSEEYKGPYQRKGSVTIVK